MRLLLILLISSIGTVLTAQEKVIPFPHLSPLEQSEIQIGIVHFELAYSRPSMRGRKIFGELEPYCDVWRTGANKNIKLSFDEHIIIKSDTLPSGTYTIFTKPGLDQWTIYFYEYIDWYGVPKGIDTLKIAKELRVQPINLQDPVETMDISFANLTYGGGTIEIRWEQTMVSIPFQIPYDSIIEDRLYEQRNTLASDYAYAANIYFSKANNLEEALHYLDLCTDIRESGRSFDQWLSNLKDKDLGLPWAHQLKSEIYAQQNDFKKAIKQAELSMKIAKVVGSKYYQKENMENLEKWKAK